LASNTTMFYRLEARNKASPLFWRAINTTYDLKYERRACFCFNSRASILISRVALRVSVWCDVKHCVVWFVVWCLG